MNIHKKKQKNKVEKVFWITIIAIFAVAIVGIAHVEINQINTSLEMFPEYLSSGDYEKVVAAYNKYIADDEVKKEEFDNDIKGVISDISLSWSEESISTDDAVNALNELSEIDSYLLSEEAKKQIDFIITESESEKLYSTAEDYFQKGEYFEALKTLVKIDKSYSQIDAVETFCKECEGILVALVSYPTSRAGKH